jgi:pilus assembly protein CpaC
MTRVAGLRQVQVIVRVAEVSRTGIRSLGINGFHADGDYFVGSTVGPNGGPINPINIGVPEASGTGDFPFAFNSDLNVSPSVTLFGGITSADLELFIQALTENQYLRLLAEPNLVALSGEQASFLAGGEFPIPVVQGSVGGTSSISIEYKEFGVGLKFRPVVLGESEIRLTVESEVSELSDIGAVEIQGFRIPAIVTRRALTTLELGSGQTFAMAGLLSETVNAQVARTPWLSSIPILGSLFRSVRYRKGQTELLVIVTASLVQPSSETLHPPLPGETHVVPSDWELYGMARIEGAAAPRISPEGAAWLEGLGLDKVKGPGAWATHERQSPRTSRSWQHMPDLGGLEWTPPVDATQSAAGRDSR